jgi:hypothetical protein
VPGIQQQSRDLLVANGYHHSENVRSVLSATEVSQPTTLLMFNLKQPTENNTVSLLFVASSGCWYSSPSLSDYGRIL